MTGRKSEGGSGARRRGCVCWGGRARAGAEPTPPRHSTLSPPTGAQRLLPLLRLDFFFFFFFVISAHHYPHTPIPGLSRHRRHPDLAESSPFIAPRSQTLRPGSLPGPSRDTMQRRRGASVNVPRGGGAGTPRPPWGPPSLPRAPRLFWGEPRATERQLDPSPLLSRVPCAPSPSSSWGVPGRIGGPLQACRKR